MPNKSQPGLGPGPPRRPTGRSRPLPPPLGLGQRDLAPVQLGPVQLVERGLEVLVGGELDDSLALVVLVRIGVAHLAGLPHVILQVLVNEEKRGVIGRALLASPQQPYLHASQGVTANLPNLNYLLRR